MLSRSSVVVLAGLANCFACSAAPDVEGPAEAQESTGSSEEALRPRHRASAVFTMSNRAEGNSVLGFRRSRSGELELEGEFATGGLGTSAGLGSQGALAVTPDGEFLVAVDAGSHEVTSFAVHGAALSVRDHVPSGGARPVSVTIHGRLVYVLNAAEPANVTGYRLERDGSLSPLEGSTQPLSAAAPNPAQVSVSPRGDVLVVSERATSMLSTFTIARGGALTPQGSFASAGTTPFGFAFSPSGTLIVSEAGTASTSSYSVDRWGRVSPISAAVPGLQRAPCWAAVSEDGRFAYIANAGSSSISGYRIDRHGAISLLDMDGVTGAAGANSRPLDMAVKDHDLYLLDAGNHAISHFEMGRSGSLMLAESELGLPLTAAGIAAY